VRFDWVSYVFGFISATVILIGLQGFIARLRWRRLNTGLRHYAKDLKHTEHGK